jgi:sugar/nucleoside kinase (ribokinase family)
MRGGLLQLSGMVVDIVQRVDHLPAPGEEVETSEFAMTAGGGFNAMAAARRMGVPVTYGGMLGQGPLAQIVADALLAEGIALPRARRAAMDQGSCVVIVDRTGERSFITYHGAEREIDVPHLASLSAPSHDFALLTGYSLYKPRSAAAFVAWFETLERPPLMVFDPGPVIGGIPRATLEATLRRADWVSANAAEAQALTGETDAAKAAVQLSRGREGALVRLGREGCWLAQGGSVRHLPGFQVEAIDTNGAGDTHDGAFIAALILGYGAGDAAMIANAAAAISTTRFGPATAPDFSETRGFLAARCVNIATPGNQERGQPGVNAAHHGGG